MTAATYALHGLRLRSELPLEDVTPVSADEDGCDIEVVLAAEGPVPAAVPAGRLLASLELDGGGYSMVETGEGYVARFHGICEFAVSAARDRIEVSIDPAGERRLVPILLGGNVMALLLSLAGECVLHAAAVEVDGAALAIIGMSGSGKSTLAALLCASGAPLFSDDLLRVVASGAGTEAFRGTAQLRLRPAAAELARRFEPAAVAETADARTGVRPPLASSERLPLGAILLPVPSREAAAVGLNRLGQRAALERLIAYPRVTGWKDMTPVGRHLQVLAEVARRVPVIEATVPWGPPFEPRLADQLRGALAAGGGEVPT